MGHDFFEKIMSINFLNLEEDVYIYRLKKFSETHPK